MIYFLVIGFSVELSTEYVLDIYFSSTRNTKEISVIQILKNAIVVLFKKSKEMTKY